MGFLAPFIPAIASGIGSLVGGKLLKQKASGPEQTVLDLQQKGMVTAAGAANKMLPGGMDLTATGAKGYGPVMDYWSKILSGNRGDATSVMAPELNRIAEGYDATQQAQSMLTPRGGGRATLMQALPYKAMQDSQSLIQRARPAAATGLLQASAGASQAGDSMVNTAINALQGSTAAGRTLLDYYQKKRETDQARGTSLGNSLFGLIKGIDFSKILGGGGNGAVGKPGASDLPSIFGSPTGVTGGQLG